METANLNRSSELSLIKQNIFLQTKELIINHVFFNFKIGEALDMYNEPPETMRLTGVTVVLFLVVGVPPF